MFVLRIHVIEGESGIAIKIVLSFLLGIEGAIGTSMKATYMVHGDQRILQLCSFRLPLFF